MDTIFQLFIAIFLVILLHELGHLLPVLLFNLLEKRAVRIQISFKMAEVIHEPFSKSWMNIIIALGGVIFPFLLLYLLQLLFNVPFLHLMFIISLFNFIFILPIFPDGRNMMNLLEKGRK